MQVRSGKLTNNSLLLVDSRTIICNCNPNSRRHWYFAPDKPIVTAVVTSELFYLDPSYSHKQIQLLYLVSYTIMSVYYYELYPHFACSICNMQYAQRRRKRKRLVQTVY